MEMSNFKKWSKLWENAVSERKTKLMCSIKASKGKGEELNVYR